MVERSSGAVQFGIGWALPGIVTAVFFRVQRLTLLVARNTVA
jgi:hypothetical protein